MTPTLKEQLEQYIERASNDSVEKWFKDNGWVATESKVIPSVYAYKAGANDIAELLLIAVGALKYSSEKLSDGQYHDADDEIYKALNKIQEKIKGE